MNTLNTAMNQYETHGKVELQRMSNVDYTATPSVENESGPTMETT